MKDKLNQKKEIASNWFRSLRDQFCKTFEEIDGGKFERKNGVIKVLEVARLVSSRAMFLKKLA